MNQLSSLGANKYPWSAKKRRSNSAQEELSNALSAIETAKPAGITEKSSPPPKIPSVQNSAHGPLDRNNPFSYAAVGSFLLDISDGNRHLRAAAELITKDKDKWERAAYKLDCDILLDRLQSTEYSMDSLLRKMPVDMLITMQQRIEPVIEQRRNEESKQKYAEAETKVEEYMAGISGLGLPEDQVEGIRNKILKEMKKKLGIKSGRAPDGTVAKSSVPRINPRSSTGLSRPGDTMLPKYALQRPPKAKGEVIAAYKGTVFGHEVYWTGKGARPLWLTYLTVVEGVNQEDCRNTENRPEAFRSQMQAYMMNQAGVTKRLRQELQKAGINV